MNANLMLAISFDLQNGKTSYNQHTIAKNEKTHKLKLKYNFCFALLLLIAGCASKVIYESADLVVTSDHSVITITSDTEIKLDTLYLRKIKKNSQFQRIGTITQGEVYKSVDSIFTIEGANIHEAYLVMSGVDLIGFYLPGKDSFSGLKNVVKLPISKG